MATEKIVTYQTTNLATRAESDGTVLFQTISHIKVNAAGISLTEFIRYADYVTEVSRRNKIICSGSAAPFLIEKSSALTIAHGTEHIAVAGLLSAFANGKGSTSASYYSDRQEGGSFQITLYGFEPRGVVFKSNEKTLLRMLTRAINETNGFFATAAHSRYP